MKRRILALWSLTTIVLLSVIGPFGSTVSVAIPGRGTLFGTDGSGGNLIAVNRRTGVGRVIGNMGVIIPALATDPRSGKVYAGSGGGAADLFTVNTSTANLTFVGSTGLGFAAIGGMDFSSSGVLFASVNIAGDGGTGSDHLARINTSTGAATVIGPYGQCTGVTIPSGGGGSCSIEGMEAIAFDGRDRLLGALSERGAAGRPGLYSINTNTGRAQFLRRIREVASGAEASGGVVSLQFGCEDGLFGGTATAIPPAADGGRLIRIDREDGDFRFVGNTSATGGSSLAALAFLGACP